MKTYTIDVALIGRLEDKLKSFQKKFNKYGNGEITYEVSEPYTIKVDGHHRQVVADVTVDASYKISGYEFVASIESTAGDNLIKKASEDVFVPEIYRTRCACDHCKTNRVRKYTVLLKNSTTNEYVQVGKSCVTDYLGRDVSDYASYLSIFDSFDEFVENSTREHLGHITKGYGFEDIVLQTLEYVSRFGYVSKAQAYDTGAIATSTAVYCALNGFNFDGETFEVYDITDASREKYGVIVEFIKNLNDTSDYYHNLKTLLGLTFIENKNLGLCVSAVGTYLRETAKKKEQSEDRIPSEHVGNIGDRIEFTSTPACISSYLGEYGWTYIYKMFVDNNVIVWKTSKALDEKECTIKATIKEHSDFRGEKQTVITRGKVVA